METLDQQVAKKALEQASDALDLIKPDATLSQRTNVITTAVRAVTAWQAVQQLPQSVHEEQ